MARNVNNFKVDGFDDAMEQMLCNITDRVLTEALLCHDLNLCNFIKFSRALRACGLVLNQNKSWAFFRVDEQYRRLVDYARGCEVSVGEDPSFDPKLDATDKHIQALAHELVDRIKPVGQPAVTIVASDIVTPFKLFEADYRAEYFPQGVPA